jgi:transposase-like protein
MEYTEDDLEARRSNERLVRWMMQERFLHDSMHCERCLTPMRLQRFAGAKKDHFVWRCPRETCKMRISVRDGSFFANSNLSLRKQLKIIINFVAESPARGTGQRLRVTRKMVGRIYKKIRRAYNDDLVTNPITFDDGFEYEVDELYLRHLRVGPGQYIRQWVAGILERRTGKLLYYRVNSRSGASLIPPIVANIPNGSFVYSDEWRGYRRLRDHPYYRFSVNHSAGEYVRLEHVGPIDLTVHINTIEGTNRWVRSKLRNRARRTRRRLDLTLAEIMYRHSGRSLFDPVKV